MPVVGFIDKKGEKWSFEQTLNGLNTEDIFGYTRDILYVMVVHSRRAKEVYSDGAISATGLLSCLRKSQLERIVPYFQEPQKLWYSLRGTALHEVLDPKGDLSAWFSEIRLYKFVGDPIEGCIYCKGSGWVRRVFNRQHLRDEPCACCSISGQIDGYDAYSQTLYDKKSIGDNGLSYLKDGAKPPHITQTNIYRWLLDGGYAYKLSSKEKRKIALAGGKVTIPDIRRKKWALVKVPVRRLVIQYFSMMHLVLTGGELVQKTSFVKSSPTKHQNEIKREVLRSFLSGASEMKQWQLTYKIPEVPIMETSDVTSYINARRHDLVTALQSNTAAPMCDEDTQKWLCDFCGVKDICRQIKTGDAIDLRNYCTLMELRLTAYGDKEKVKEM